MGTADRKPATLAFVDVESTGLDPERNEVWEVALILRQAVDGGQPTETEYVWQLPVDLGRADSVALTIGHFYERRLQSTYDANVGNRRDERIWPRCFFADEFAALTHGAHMVGAVPSFDDAFLKRLLRANGACPGWHYHLIDVEALAAASLITAFATCQAVGNPDADGPTQEEALLAFPPWRSNDLSLAVGVDPEHYERHTALGDARWAKAIYDAVMGPHPATDERTR